MRTIQILIFLVLFSVMIKGQQADTIMVDMWSLDDCIQYAVQNSPKVKKQEAQNMIYQQDYLNAVGRLMPSLNAGTRADINFGRGVDSETNLYTNVNTFSNNYSLYTNLMLFDGFANIYRIKMQKANKLLGKEQMEQERETVAFNTMEAFVNVLYYKQMAKLAMEQAEESRNNMKQTQRMEELGIKAKTDLTEMAAKEAADNYLLTKQKNLLSISLILLKEIMNYPMDRELHIEDDLIEIPILIIKEPTAEIYRTAKTFNPKALSAASALEAHKMNRLATKGSLIPIISMDAGLSTGFVKHLDGSEYESFTDQLKNKRGTYIGFTLSLPLFNGFSRSTAYKISKAQESIAENEYYETLRTLYSEIEQAFTDLNGQAKVYHHALKQREAMELAHKANQRRYEEGMISPLELHTSANRVMEAKTQELNAKVQYRLKARLVDYYKGESLIK